MKNIQKYLLAVIFGTLAMALAVWLTNGFYVGLGFISAASAIPFSIELFIQFILLSFMIAYVHELVPHCATPYWNKGLRFAFLMTFVSIAFLLPYEYSFTWETLYKFEFAGAIAFLPSLVIMFVLYQHEPAKSIHKGGVCSVGI